MLGSQPAELRSGACSSTKQSPPLWASLLQLWLRLISLSILAAEQVRLGPTSRDLRVLCRAKLVHQGQVLQLRSRIRLLLLHLLSMLVSLQLCLLSCSILVADVHGIHRMHACQPMLDQICVGVLFRIMRIILLIEYLRAVDYQTISKMGTGRLGARDLGEDANSMALARALLCLLLSEMTWHAGFSELVVAVIIL